VFAGAQTAAGTTGYEDAVLYLNTLYSRGEYQEILRFDEKLITLAPEYEPFFLAYAAYLKGKAAERMSRSYDAILYFELTKALESNLPDDWKYLSWLSNLALFPLYVSAGETENAVSAMSEYYRLEVISGRMSRNAETAYGIIPPSGRAVKDRANRVFAPYFQSLTDVDGDSFIIFTLSPEAENYVLNRYPHASGRTLTGNGTPPSDSNNTLIIYHKGYFRVLANVFFNSEQNAREFGRRISADCDGIPYLVKDFRPNGIAVQFGAFESLQFACDKAADVENYLAR
jgi:hypothetical protein